MVRIQCEFYDLSSNSVPFGLANVVRHDVSASTSTAYVTCHKLYDTCHMSYIAPHMSYIACQKCLAFCSDFIQIYLTCQPVTCYMSYDAFHMSHVIHYMSLEMPWMHACCSECIQPVSHFNLSYVTYVTCDMSHVICNMPHVTSHVPNVTCRISHVLGHVMHCSESMMLAK